MLCPLCGSGIEERPRSYTCGGCGLVIWKKIAGRCLAREEVEFLLRERRTGVLQGFRSRDGRTFSAALVLQDGEVRLDYAESRAAGNLKVRVESGRSGTVRVSLSGACSVELVVDFGLVPSRLAECLGVITACKLAEHRVGKADRLSVSLSVNNRDFARYALRERIPSRPEIRRAVEHMWETLGRFGGWELCYEPRRRVRLAGGTVSERFPRGVFPWLRAEVRSGGSEIYVALPECPAVRAQFLASVRTAKFEQGEFVVPKTAEKVVRAWLAAVKGNFMGKAPQKSGALLEWNP
ncbi:MAG: topoisomerase C-terminal repeat-containing protein [Desulfotomaculales bacterium]